MCLFGVVLRYLSISDVLSMHDRVRCSFVGTRSPIHTSSSSEYCAAAAIAAAIAAATGAVNASPFPPTPPPSPLYFPLAPWAGSRETNLDVFPDSEIGGGGGDGVNGLLPRTFGAFPPSPRASLAHSGIAPNPIRTRFNLRRRRRHALNFNFAQMGIGYREGRRGASERAHTSRSALLAAYPLRPSAYAVLQKEIGRTAALNFAPSEETDKNGWMVAEVGTGAFLPLLSLNIT